MSKKMVNTNNISESGIHKFIMEHDSIFVIIFIVTEIRLVWNFLFGFRWPSAYVLSNNVFTYEYGFMPRALIASILKVLFGNHIYSFKLLYILITGTSILILLFFMYMSYYFCFKDRKLVGSVMVLWYSLSIYSAYLSHEAGYFEQYAYLLLCMLIMGSSMIKSPFGFSGICAAIGFICLLISETNAFLILPTLFMMCVIRFLKRSAEEEHPINRKCLCKDLIFLSLINLPSLVYCAVIGKTLVPESRVLKQLELIRSHSSRFERLDEIGGYFYSGSRMPESYTQIMEFRVWNWQLKFYLVLILLTVILVLVAARRYHKAAGYALAIMGIVACIYCLHFIAWDTERFKFAAAMAVTLFSLWIVKEMDGGEMIVNRELIRILIFGTAGMFMIMDYRLGLFDSAVYNNSWAQFKATLKDTWRINY